MTDMNNSDALTPDDLREARERVTMQHQWTLAEQIAELTINQQDVSKQLSRGVARIKSLEDAMSANTQATVEILDVMSGLKSGFKVLGWLGMALKWAGAIVGAITAIYVGLYMVTHGGNTPGSK